jgi:hypothetical protein
LETPAVKRQTHSIESIEKGNNARYVTTLGSEDTNLWVQDLVTLLTEVADLIADGGDVYLTFGANRARTALVWSLSENGVKAYAAGHTFEDSVKAAAASF